MQKALDQEQAAEQVPSQRVGEQPVQRPEDPLDLLLKELVVRVHLKVRRLRANFRVQHLDKDLGQRVEGFLTDVWTASVAQERHQKIEVVDRLNRLVIGLERSEHDPGRRQHTARDENLVGS